MSPTLWVQASWKRYMRVLLCMSSSCGGIHAVAEASFPVTYKGCYVGEYFADILVENTVVVELKCVDRLGNEHLAQCLNYLRASDKELCLLGNFQRPKLEWRRVVRSPLPLEP